MTSEDTPRPSDQLHALRAEISTSLEQAFEMMGADDTDAAAKHVLAAAATSVGHLTVTLSLLAASSASILREAMPIDIEAGSYYAFLAVDADTQEIADLPAPMAFASRFMTSACNLDHEQGKALLEALLNSHDSDYMLDCLLATFLQAWHIHAGHSDPTSIDLGGTTMRGLAINNDRDKDN